LKYTKKVIKLIFALKIIIIIAQKLSIFRILNNFAS